jgi:acyl carrier protein
VTRIEILAVITELAGSIDPRIDAAAIRYDDTPLTAYGLTSLTTVQLFAMLEDRLAIRIGDGEGLRVATAADLVNLVGGKLATAGSGAS